MAGFYLAKAWPKEPRFPDNAGMTMSSVFSYPARLHDRVLTAAGEVEELARAAVRHLRSGGRLGSAAALPGRYGHAEVASRALPEDAPTGPPILYLPAVSWSYRFQRPQHLALALARAGHPVLY